MKKKSMILSSKKIILISPTFNFVNSIKVKYIKAMIKKIKVYLWQKKIERSYKLKISKQINRCCLTGRAKFFIKNFGLSRHAVNLHAFEGLLQNTKVRSW